MANRKSNVRCEASKFLDRVEVSILDMKSDPSNGFAYIGHAEDLYTKFGVLFPLKDKSPKEIAQSLKKYFISYFGPPVSFVSDCEQSFLTDVLCEVLDCWKGDGLSFTLCDNIQTNTQTVQMKRSDVVAKFVRDNISMMAAECSEDYSWSDWLPEIMLRLNVARHTFQHHSPYSAVFRQKTPALLLAEQQDLRLDCDGIDVDDGADKLKASMRVDVVAHEHPNENKLKTSGKERASECLHQNTINEGIVDTASVVDSAKVKLEPCDTVAVNTSLSESQAEQLSNRSPDRNRVTGRSDEQNEFDQKCNECVNDNGEAEDVRVEDGRVEDVRVEDGCVTDPSSQNQTSWEVMTDMDQSVIIKLEPEYDDDTPADSSCRGIQSGATDDKPSEEEYYTEDIQEGQDNRPEVSGLCGDKVRYPSAVHWNTQTVSDLGSEQPCIEIDYAEDSNSCENLYPSGSALEGNGSAGVLQMFEVKRKLSLDDHSYIENLKAMQPSLTLTDIKHKLLYERNVEVHISTISRAIKRMSAYQECMSGNIRLDNFCDNTVSFPDQSEMSLSPVSSVQNELDLTSSSPPAEMEEDFEEEVEQTDVNPLSVSVDEGQKNMTARMSFTPEDDLYLNRLLDIRPLLSVDEIKDRLETEIGLVVTCYNLTKKIASMSNRAPKPKPKTKITLQLSEVSPDELGVLVNRNLKCKRRSYFVKRSSGQPLTSELISENGRESTHFNRKHQKRNISSSSDQDMDSPDEELAELQFGDTGILSKSKSSTLSKGNKRAFQDNFVIDLSESPPPENTNYPKIRRQTDLSVSRKLEEADLFFLKKLKDLNPLITLTELKYQLLLVRKTDVHIQAVSKAMRKIFQNPEYYNHNAESEYRGDDTDSLTRDVRGTVDSSAEDPYPQPEEQDEDTDMLDLSAGLDEGRSAPSTVEDKQDTSSTGVNDGSENSEGNTSKKLTFSDLQYIHQLKQENPKLTLREMKAILSAKINLDIHLSTISRALKKMKSAIVRKASRRMSNSVIDLT